MVVILETLITGQIKTAARFYTILYFPQDKFVSDSTGYTGWSKANVTNWMVISQLEARVVRDSLPLYGHSDISEGTNNFIHTNMFTHV